MTYRYLEDIATADVAFEARGATFAEMVVAAADATMNVMVEDLGAIEPENAIPVDLENDSPDMLLFDLLQELIFYKDARELLLRVTDVKVSVGESWRLTCTCRGQTIDPTRHKLVVDVKAVTLHLFTVEQSAAGWTARVVLDI